MSLVSPEFDRLLYHSEHFSAGQFRAAVGHPRFHDSGPAPAHLLVFPRTAVAIEHEGAARFVVGPPMVTMYNAGQRYRRVQVSPDGDRCEWFAFSASFAAQLLAALDPKYSGDPAQPFRASHGPCNAAGYLAQRRFTQRCLQGSPIDALEAEEFAVALALMVFPAALLLPVPATERLVPRQRRWVEQAKELLLDWQSELSVADLAARIGCSRFHLCRSFRQHTGLSLHAFREQSRLRRALEALEGGRADLTELALDLGYASHSHFSYAFRRQFGVTPGAYRQRGA
jgi:AraC-like DNA-binding protein